MSTKIVGCRKLAILESIVGEKNPFFLFLKAVILWIPRKLLAESLNRFLNLLRRGDNFLNCFF
jgi:hypothetical protein